MKQKVKRLLACVLLFALVLSCMPVFASVSVGKTILYIATDGSDKNAGTIDAPFASFEKARDTIRSMRKAGTLGEGGAVVYVRGGEYLMSKGVEFTEEDSGTENAPVTFRSYPGEDVTISGAIDVDFASFKKLDDQGMISRLSDKSAADKIVYINLYDLGLTEIPEPEWRGVYTYTYDMPNIMGKQKPDSVPSELLVNGKAQTIARYPNNDYLVISQVDDTGEIVRNWYKDYIGTDNYTPEDQRTTDPMIFRITDVRAKNWINADELLVYGTFVHSWADQTLPVAKINPDLLQITTKYPSVYGCAKDQLIYFYNLFEEIDSPGEYYIDRKSGNLYWYSVKETIESINLTVLEDYVFTLNNVKHFNIKGIDMENVRAGMVKAAGCENVSVLDCEMSISGRRAIVFSNAKNCRVANNYIHNVEGGIQLGGGDRKTLTPGNNVIENNEFFACDRLTKQQTPAITLEGVANQVLHNKVGEAEQMLVLFSGNDHLIAFNEIYDGCKNTDDIGAIYAGRSLSQRGNKIFYNYFHDIGETTRGSNGVHAIFLDDFWEAAHINGNVFENILGAGVMCAGSYNTITNNIFANIGKTSCSLNRSYDYGTGANSSDSTLRESLLNVDYLSDTWVSKYPEIANAIGEEGKLDINNYITAKNNVLYKAPEPTVSFEISQTALIENNKTYTDDPGFVDLAGRNYTLKQDSKVYTDIEGFQPIPFTRMGLYSQRAIHRVKDSGVFALNSPDAIINGEHTNTEYDVLTTNGNVYIPVRVAAQLVEGEVSYDEATQMISVSSSTQQLLFAGGGTTSATVNGEEVKLESSTLEINGTNYLSAQDVAKAFGRALIEVDGIYVITEDEGLIDKDGDAELVRYYQDALSIY